MAVMGWRTTGDVAEFLAAAGEYLRRERAKNTVILTVTEQLRVNREGDAATSGTATSGTATSGTATSGTATSGMATSDDAPGGAAGPQSQPLFGWWSGTAGGAFMHTPPYPLMLTDVVPDAADDLAVTLAGRTLHGINAYPESAERFAALWRSATRCRVVVQNRQRLYRLGALSTPDPAPDGGPRVATAADLPLLAAWFAAFAREAHGNGGEHDHKHAVRDRVSYGGIVLWEAGSEPVSMAAISRQVAGMVRVGPVYTPPDLRGHGYASAVTAEASRRAVAAGAEEVLLYTDLANPVSNSIYQRIGYRGVEDRLALAFLDPELPLANLAFPGRGCILEGIMLLPVEFSVPFYRVPS